MDEPTNVGPDYLRLLRFHDRPRSSARKYARIVPEWVLSIGLEVTASGTHAMHRKKITQINKNTDYLNRGVEMAAT